MAKLYYSVLTTYGAQAFANAIANNRALHIQKMAVGDGNGKTVTPDSTRTALAREKYKANISAISRDPRNNKQVIFELTIPENIGGFWIREMGIFDDQNRLVAYANCPESFKPELASGSGKVQVIRMILLVSSSDSVTLTVDDSVIFATRGQLTPQKITATTQNSVDQTGHTHEIDKASLTTKGLVQLTNDTGLESESLALTAKAGKHISQQVAQLQQNIANNYIQNSKKSSAVNSHSTDTVATSAAVKTAYDKATNAENNANGRVSKAGDTMTGGLSINHATGAGGFAGQYTANAPFFADVGNAQGRNNYYPYIKGRVSNGDGWGTALSFGYVTPTNRNQFGQGVIHLIEDNGSEQHWFFHHTGEFRSAGDVKTSTNVSLNALNDIAVKRIGNPHNIQLRWENGLEGKVDNTELGGIHYSSRSYVTTTTDNWGGLIIERPNRNDRMLVESNGNSFAFIRRNNQQNHYVITTPERNGTIALEGEAISTSHKGYGAYNQQYHSGAPIMVEETGSRDKDTYHPIVKARVRGVNRYGTAFSFGYTTRHKEEDDWGYGVIHLIEDTGKNKYWTFEHGGNFCSAGDVITGQGRSLNQMKEVAVLAGEVNHDGWIPLPEGFSEAQCRWMVSIRDDNPTNRGWDIEEDLTSTHYRFQCYTNGRQVIARTWQSGHGSAGSTWIPAKANYIIIGVK